MQLCGASSLVLIPHMPRPRLLFMQEAMAGTEKRKKLPMGAMQKLPRVFPGHELLSRAIKRTERCPEDTTIRNSRMRSASQPF